MKISDGFEKGNMSLEEVEEGIGKLDSLIQSIDHNEINVIDAFQNLVRLEIEFEQVHLNTMMKIKDESLRILFEALSKGNKKHTERLQKILSLKSA